VVAVTVDVSRQEVAAAIVAAAGGKVDVLVNNVGIMDGFLPSGEVDDATWERVMAVNLTGPMRLTRAVLPGMAAVKKGAIVNISSEVGLRGSCAGVAYTSSKHALIGMTLTTAFMYGPAGIMVNAVAPGAVQTSIEAPFKSALAGERLGKLFPVVVTGAAQPEQLASSILFLASDAASNVNGVVLPCDGGWSAI
jgi:NAD(P)-dependent dehydrogenase (short-subunit alcohol dehydrogenase family)